MEKEKGGQAVSQQALTSRQRAATGPFLAYVNLCKPLLQNKRPDLSLLEVLKELASQWNGMSKVEKQKFAVIAKESEDKQEVSAVSFANTSRSAENQQNAENADKLSRWFSVMLVSKLLLTPIKIRIFGPKTAKFGPKS